MMLKEMLVFKYAFSPQWIPQIEAQ